MSDEQALCVRCETRDCGAVNSRKCLEVRNIKLDEEVSKLQTACFFFASVIKSGEPWSSTCEDMMKKVRDDK